jgi:hypothetical protein
MFVALGAPDRVDDTWMSCPASLVKVSVSVPMTTLNSTPTSTIRKTVTTTAAMPMALRRRLDRKALKMYPPSGIA